MWTRSGKENLKTRNPGRLPGFFRKKQRYARAEIVAPVKQRGGSGIFYDGFTNHITFFRTDSFTQRRYSAVKNEKLINIMQRHDTNDSCDDIFNEFRIH